MQQGSFLIAEARGTRTTPLREYRDVKSLRRSQLARLAYVPEPVVVLPAPKKNLLKGLGRLVRPVALLALAALILFGIKAARNWFDSNFAYGALNPGRTLVNSWSAMSRHRNCLTDENCKPVTEASCRALVRFHRSPAARLAICGGQRRTAPTGPWHRSAP